MKIKRILTGVLAAFVLVASTPAVSTVLAETTNATNATPSQEVTVKKPSKVTATAKKGAIKVTIKEVEGATAYQIQYST